MVVFAASAGRFGDFIGECIMASETFILSKKRSNLVNILSFEQLGKLLFAIYGYDGENDIFHVFTEHEELNDPAVMAAYKMLFNDHLKIKEKIRNERMD